MNQTKMSGNESDHHCCMCDLQLLCAVALTEVLLFSCFDSYFNYFYWSCRHNGIKCKWAFIIKGIKKHVTLTVTGKLEVLKFFWLSGSMLVPVVQDSEISAIWYCFMDKSCKNLPVFILQWIPLEHVYIIMWFDCMLCFVFALHIWLIDWLIKFGVRDLSAPMHLGPYYGPFVPRMIIMRALQLYQSCKWPPDLYS
jgi:hypothetical protein